MKISNKVEIQASPDRVFYWLDDPDRAMKWMTSVTKSEIIKETPNKVGTTFREYIEENGRGVEMRGVITEFVPNKHFAVRLEGAFNWVEVGFTLEEEGGVTRLTQNAELRFKGVMKVLSLFLRPSIKKKINAQAQKEFSRLKELCEQEKRE